MPSISFKGASGFTISGGNFSEIGGSVVTYNIGQPAKPQRIDQLPPLTSPEEPERRHSQAAHRESIQQAPPSPSAPSTGRVSTWATPAGSTNHSASTSSILGIEERQHLGPSEPTSSQQQNSLELLTPLTDSLNLHRFTPSAQPQILSPVFETTCALSPELPSSRAGYRTSASPGSCEIQASSLSCPPPPLPARPASRPLPPASPYRPVSSNETLDPITPPPLTPHPLIAASESEDHSSSFAQLQVQHTDMEDYAYGSNTITHTPQPHPLSQSPQTSGNNTPQQTFARPNDPMNYSSSGAQTPSAPPRFPPSPSVTSTTIPASPLSPLGPSSVNDGNSVATSQSSHHWTCGSISNWAINVRPSEGGYDSDSSRGSNTAANYVPSYNNPSPTVSNPHNHAYPTQHYGYAPSLPVPPPPPVRMFPQYSRGYAQPWAPSTPLYPQQHQNYEYGHAVGYGGHMPAPYLGSSGLPSFPMPSF